VFAMVSLSLDILSLVAIEYRNVLPLFLVKLICKTYVISLIWVGVSATFYVLTDVFPAAKHKKIIWAMVLVTDIQGLIVYLLPIHIGQLLSNKEVSVKVLPTHDKWFGVTYKEDKDFVVESFKQLIADGVYNENLFSDL